MKCFLIHRATDVNIILRMGSLSRSQYSTFHDISRNSSSWVYLRGDTAFWALDHTEVLVYGSYRGACHSFHLFSHGNCNSVHLSGISLTHYRTMLVVIPFFPFCNLEKKKKKVTSWSKLVLTTSGACNDETRGNIRVLVIPVRSRVPANMLSS